MKAEIIAIGSELLSPDRVDTNSLYLTQKLNEAGFEVRLKSVVGDRVGDIEALLLDAIRRSRITVACGGLGPTEDDLTRSAAARALRRRLSINSGLLEGLRRRFARRGIRMAAINERQAEVIEGAEILENPVGSAPGMWIQDGESVLVLLPGPPRELQSMFEAHVVPRLAGIGSGRRLVRKSLGIHGLTESEADSRVAPIYREYPRIQTTILAAMGVVTLRLQRWLEPGEEAEDLAELTSRMGRELGTALFTTAGETLEAVVGRLLRQSGLMLSVAESCTAGLVGATVSSIPGSSDYFLGGVLCYSNELKTKLCGVPREMLESHGAVSPEVAERLACGVRDLTRSNVGLSVTGIAGPGGGSEEKPVGLVYVGLADASRCIHRRRIFPGDRATVRRLTVNHALGLLRRFLMGDESIP
jgi:nicotinamide-nucleotide amidase